MVELLSRRPHLSVVSLTRGILGGAHRILAVPQPQNVRDREMGHPGTPKRAQEATPYLKRDRCATPHGPSLVSRSRRHKEFHSEVWRKTEPITAIQTKSSPDRCVYSIGSIARGIVESTDRCRRKDWPSTRRKYIIAASQQRFKGKTSDEAAMAFTIKINGTDHAVDVDGGTP